MTTERTYTELEVMVIMLSMRDLHRTYPNAHYLIDRDLMGRIIGWKVTGAPREPAVAQDPEWRLPPDHGITTGNPSPDALAYLLVCGLLLAVSLVGWMVILL